MFRAAVGVAAVAVAAAQQTGSRPLPTFGEPHPDVETSPLVLGVDVDAAPVKEQVKIMCGFVNNGDSPLNISGIIGSLNNPMDFSQYIFNLSGMAIGEVVAPGEEATLQYGFQLPELQEYPSPFQVALTVFYEDDAGSGYTTTFFNETVTFVGPKASYDVASYLPTMIAAFSTLLFAAFLLEAIPFLKDRVSKVKVSIPGTVSGPVETFDEASLDIRPAKKDRSSSRSKSN